MKLEPKTHEWIYLNERYEVCSSNGCCTIGEIYLDLEDYEWVFDNKDNESGTCFYQGEIDEVSYLLNKLNKRDKLGKYKPKVEKKMTTFAKGDVVRWNGAYSADLYEVGTLAEVDRVEYLGGQEYLYVRVTNQDEITGHFSWRWDYVTSKTSDKEETTVKTEPKKNGEVKTGGSTPNQYRLSVNLPLTSDRTQFVDVDLEAMDVSDALDLSGNLRDVQKALFRMGKKDGVSEAYDFNKQLFCTLREMKKRGIISHAKFWEAAQALDSILQAEDAK